MSSYANGILEHPHTSVSLWMLFLSRFAQAVLAPTQVSLQTRQGLDHYPSSQPVPSMNKNKAVLDPLCHLYMGRQDVVVIKPKVSYREQVGEKHAWIYRRNLQHGRKKTKKMKKRCRHSSQWNASWSLSHSHHVCPWVQDQKKSASTCNNVEKYLQTAEAQD